MTECFQSLAERAKKGGGLPGLNLIVVPHPFDTLSKEEVEQVAERFIGQTVASLTSEAMVRVFRRRS